MWLFETLPEKLEEYNCLAFYFNFIFRANTPLGSDYNILKFFIRLLHKNNFNVAKEMQFGSYIYVVKKNFGPYESNHIHKQKRAANSLKYM